MTDQDNDQEPEGLAILIPVYDDWRSCRVLLSRLDECLRLANLRARVVLVDDGSTEPFPRESFEALKLRRLHTVSCIRLRANLGHQRAICVGLVATHVLFQPAELVVMDADGEDDPADVPRLVDSMRRQETPTAVFALRQKRAEGIIFRLFYLIYRLTHRLLVGHGTRMGNFSVLPAEVLERLVVVSDLWNHYAASVVSSKQPFETMPTARKKRIGGRSRMHFAQLVVHGLSAIAVFADIVGVRLLMSSFVMIGLTLSGIAAVAGIRLFTELAIPGWASATAGILTVLLVQALLLSAVFVLVILGARNRRALIPLRDCPIFIADVTTVTCTSMPSSGREDLT